MKKLILATFVTIFMSSCNLNSQVKLDKKIDELINLAVISDSLMDLSSSVKYYTEVLTLDSTKLIALNNRGRALVWLGEINRGFTDFDMAVKLYPHEETHYTRGMTYLSINKFNKASDDLMKSIELNPKFVDAYYGLSLLKYMQDSLKEALIFCNIADNISYRPKDSHQMRAVIFQKREDFESAIYELNETIKLIPNSPENYNNRGLAKNELGYYQDAIADFNHAIQLNSKMAFVYNNKAFALFKLNQLDNALKTVNMSLELNGSNAYALKNRGEIFNALKQPDKACIDLAEASKLSNDKKLTMQIQTLRNKICK